MLNDANLQLEFRPRKVILKNLVGSAVGGQLTAKGLLEDARAGVNFAGEIMLENANLADLVPAYVVSPGVAQSPQPARETNAAPPGPATSPVAGNMTLTAAVSGQALTLRGLVASLQGAGETKLEEVVIRGLSPGAVATAANAILVEGETLEGNDLKLALKAQLARGETVIPTSKIPLKVVDGAMRFSPFVARGRTGALRNVTTVDLTNLSVDNVWELKSAKPKSKAGNGKAGTTWPDVRVGYVGLLANLGQITPELSIGELERELAVRRIQRNVDELERLRREDEERATAERERRKQRELERARAAEREDKEADTAPPAPRDPNSVPQTGDQPDQGAVANSDILKEDLPAVDEQKIRRRVKKRRRAKRRNSQSTGTTRFNQQSPYPY